MLPLLAHPFVASPQAFFTLFIEIVLVGLFFGIAIWIYRTWIQPNIPAPFVWIANVLIGLGFLCLLFWFFLLVF